MTDTRPPRIQLANALRVLSMDAVQNARSGHPGAPMGLADVAEVLWNDYLCHNPANPAWPARDRFVLSNGHASMLLYALLHLTGYDLPLDEIKHFRQLRSKTPGHPEYGMTPGVETTTGPLGQGFANAVGMAIAERTLAAQFNRPDFNIVDHHTYVIVGDGCLMEGISHEACSLAGTLRLGKLIAIYDANNISIDGEVGAWFADDTAARFRACNWHVTEVVDGHDPAAVARGIEAARAECERPSLIPCRTVIGYGAPDKAGSADCHGAPLGDDEIAAARDRLGWEAPPFVVPAAIREAWDARAKGAAREDEWNDMLRRYRKCHPDEAAGLERRLRGELPAEWDAYSAKFIATRGVERKAQATRKASGQAMAAYSECLPELFGGSADLAESNCVLWQGMRAIHEQSDGNYLHYGVREFAMAAISSGIALHGGFIPYAATFLVFSDYARNAIRLAALMRQRVLFVMTHDSVALGEDGPTHQPVEHLASLRMIPDIDVWRPADTVETAVAWRMMIERTDGPGVIALSRQTLPANEYDAEQIANVQRGGYVLFESGGAPELVLIATGSELCLVVEAAQHLAESGRAVRVVSMPCVEVFERQPKGWQSKVLPEKTPRLVVEAGSGAGWYRYAGHTGRVLGLERFGESAPGNEVYGHLGFRCADVVALAEEILRDK